MLEEVMNKKQITDLRGLKKSKQNRFLIRHIVGKFLKSKERKRESWRQTNKKKHYVKIKTMHSTDSLPEIYNAKLVNKQY